MDTNPYQAPATEATGIANPSGARRHGPVMMAFLGLLTGGVTGVTSGAIAAALIGFLASFLVMAYSDYATDVYDSGGMVVGFTVAGAILGGMMGGFFCAIGGSLLGLVAGLSAPTLRGILVYASMGFCGLVGGGGGLLAGWMFANAEFKSVGLAIGTMAIAISLGLLCGCGGGFLLGRGLGVLAWGSAKAVPFAQHAEAETIANTQ